MNKTISKTKTKRFFTLLEILVALTLLTIAAGAIGYRVQKMVKKKHFQTQVEKFKERLMLTQKLAISMQADWVGILKKEKDAWVFETFCEEISTKKLTPLRLDSLLIHLDGKEQKKLRIDFFASGKVFPNKTFTMTNGSETVQHTLHHFFETQAKKNQEPIHPNQESQ